MEAWEAPLGVQAALAPVQEALRRPAPGGLPPGGGGLGRGEALVPARGGPHLPAPFLPQGVAW